jgi:hypothetical protein
VRWRAAESTADPGAAHGACDGARRLGVRAGGDAAPAGSRPDGLDPDYAYLRTPLILLVLLGIVTIQVTVICVWRLLTMVRRGTVLSRAAFRYVDVVMGAALAASVLTMGLAVTLAPGEAVAPGIVLLICGAALMAAGVALIVLVLRMLLVQAVARDAEAHHLPGRAGRGDPTPIVVDVDVMLARRKMSVGTLAERVGITPANLAVRAGACEAVRPPYGPPRRRRAEPGGVLGRWRMPSCDGRPDNGALSCGAAARRRAAGRGARPGSVPGRGRC